MSLGSSDAATGQLREWRRAVNLRAEVLAVMHDLDGALAAQQWGLVATACRELVSAGLRCWLVERGVAVPTFAHPLSEWRVAIERAEAVTPELGRSAWQLYLAPVGDGPAAEAHAHRVLAFVSTCLGLAEPLTLASSIRTWADAYRALREAYRQLQIPLSDDWYLVGDSASDWYDLVVASLERYESEGPRR